MTRNTKIHHFYINKDEYLIRDLNVNELNILDKMKNDNIKFDMAARMALINNDPDSINWQVLQQIGAYILSKSYGPLGDELLREIAIDTLRDNIPKDSTLILISHIISVFPSESILKLLELTYQDLLELTVFAEIYSGKKLLNVNTTNSNKLKRGPSGKLEFPDEPGVTLADKMRNQKSLYDIPR